MADAIDLRKAKFHIVAVLTPVNNDYTPDLSPVEGASRILGHNLARGSIVVFESMVYSGVTEEVCVPILGREPELTCGVDFKIGDGSWKCAGVGTSTGAHDIWNKEWDQSVWKEKPETISDEIVT